MKPHPGRRWRPAPSAPVLGERELHLWCFPLDPGPGHMAPLAGLLDGAERAGCRRLRGARARREQVAARAALRRILSLYVGRPPGRLEFRRGPFGKPYLRQRAGPEIYFNLSHSGGFGLVGVTRAAEVGVDLEFRRRDRDWRRLAARFFAPEELAWLEGLPAGERLGGFYRIWTLKEAWLKATGHGLRYGLGRFAVASPRGISHRPYRIDGPHGDRAWRQRSLGGLAGHAIAVTHEGPTLRLRCWRTGPGGPRA